MGKVKFLRGVESHYNATTHQDGVYFTTDDDNVNSIIMNGRKYGVPYAETTYSALKGLRDGGFLTPGAWYRITDYVTTTTQADTQSANHPFDVIVLATSTNTLSEEARAIQHSGDTYFANSNLSAWKVWYCLDNDKSRFAWADDSVDGGSPAFLTESGVNYYRDVLHDSEGSKFPYAWTSSENVTRYTKVLEPSGDVTLVDNPNTIRATEYTVSYTPASEGTGLPNGRGVIYRLIDEFNNDIKYDFKNIQFKRTITNGQYDDVNGTETWCYTLNVWYQNMCQDASVIGNTLINDEDYVVGVYKNKFGTCTEYDVYGGSGNTLKFRLGNNVVLTVDYGNEYYGCRSNTIGNSFYNNTIGNNFYGNTIGDSFSNNTIGNAEFYNNTIGNYFLFNTIGNDFIYNTIGNTFYQNTIGDVFSTNTIGNDFRGNTIGNSFYQNTIGNHFYQNTIGTGFVYNTISNHFLFNTIGNSFDANTIGNGFRYNTIGTVTGSTATTIDYVRNIRVEDGVQYVNITTSAITSSSAYLQNITISQGIAGTSSSRKTITHPTVGDTFQTIYRPTNSQVITV